METIKNVIKSTLRSLDEQGVNNPQARWEFLKYEIRKKSIQFSKTQSIIKNRERLELENKLKVFEDNSVLQCDNEYLDCKERLNNLYQGQINGIRIRSRCDWYEYGEKSSKFFLNLETSRAVQGQIRYLLSGDNELTNKKGINNHLYMFYKSLFTKNKKLSETQITYFLDEISNFPKLTNKQSNDCEAPLSEKELFDALKGMPDNK